MQVFSVDELVKYQGESVIVDSFEAVPISVLESIKAEIRQIVDEETEHDKTWSRGLHYALCIIDKHTSKDMIGDTDENSN